MQATDNLRIKTLNPLISPSLLSDEIPLSEKASLTVNQAREEIQSILKQNDDRLMVVVGPCSIHDPIAAIEYAKKLKYCRKEYRNELCIIMRVYFEKPRTTVGWKGLINDPKLDRSFNINQGLRIARRLLLAINELGVPTGSEFLDTIIPQYISDLSSWGAIGARTTESQIHRELASGLSMPVGFKNGTTGNIEIAIDAILAAQQPHHFLGVSKQGLAAIISTTGNPYCHVILRGSKTRSNYDAISITKTEQFLENHSLPLRIMVDCSHGNSNKDYTQQAKVVDSVIEQLLSGNNSLFGIMIESNLIPGSQKIISGKPMTYGKSITDGCIGWEETERILAKLSQAIKKKKAQRTNNTG